MADNGGKLILPNKSLIAGVDEQTYRSEMAALETRLSSKEKADYDELKFMGLSKIVLNKTNDNFSFPSNFGLMTPLFFFTNDKKDLYIRESAAEQLVTFYKVSSPSINDSKQLNGFWRCRLGKGSTSYSWTRTLYDSSGSTVFTITENYDVSSITHLTVYYLNSLSS